MDIAPNQRPKLERRKRSILPVLVAVESIPLRFARVVLAEPPRSALLTVRGQLRNGRRAEVELSDRGELAEVPALLEQPA